MVHHTIEIAAPSSATDELIGRLEPLPGVVSLAVERGASVKPLGDVVTVHVLNRTVNEVLAAARQLEQHGPVAITTSRIDGLLATGDRGEIDDDADESPWEEFEHALRHHSRLSVNYLCLMAIGGALAVAGLLSPPVPQALALAAAAILTPAFEPVAKLAVGLVRRSGYRVRRAVVSLVVGYSVLAAAGGVTFLALRGLGLASPTTMAASEGIHLVVDPTAADWLVGAGGAAAGLLIVTSFREAALAGALIALALVPAGALVGVGIVTGDLGLAANGLQRAGLDMALVLLLGGTVVVVKDALFHRRSPLTANRPPRAGRGS